MVRDKLHDLKPGDTINIDTHPQDFTVTETMFGGEMVELEGPRGGERSLVENVNSGTVRVLKGGDTEGVVSDIDL